MIFFSVKKIYFSLNRYSTIDSVARRKNATRETTNTLKAWLYEHRKNPYPTKGEKIMLAIITKMTLTQVSDRFFSLFLKKILTLKYGMDFWTTRYFWYTCLWTITVCYKKCICTVIKILYYVTIYVLFILFFLTQKFLALSYRFYFVHKNS